MFDDDGLSIEVMQVSIKVVCLFLHRTFAGRNAIVAQGLKKML
jgi:hypothetical protein